MRTIVPTSLILCTLAASLAAATAPYSNDFSGIGANTALTELTDSIWAINSGAYRYTFTSTTVAYDAASTTITNLAGMDFTMEAQFTVSSTGTVNANSQTLGFGLFGATSGFGGAGSSAYYLADWQYTNTASPGKLRILALGDTSGFSAVDSSVDDNAGSATLAVNLGTTYTLRLQGSYSSTVLNMTLGLYDATGTTQIGSSATAIDTSPLTGTNFGLRNRTGLSGGSAIIDFDNLSVTAIPEPSAALPMGALALFGCALTRRKTHRRA